MDINFYIVALCIFVAFYLFANHMLNSAKIENDQIIYIVNVTEADRHLTFKYKINCLWFDYSLNNYLK